MYVTNSVSLSTQCSILAFMIIVIFISATSEITHDADTKSMTQEGQSEKEGVSSNTCLVLKRVEHFSRPATFQSIKIDLFVMKGDPFRILRACNLCEMGVSLRKTGRQRLKNDRGKEETGSSRDWEKKKKIGLLF